MQNKNWYAAKSAGRGQGLVIDENTGRNIAVTYDETDAPLIVDAVNAHAALLAVARARDFAGHDEDCKAHNELKTCDCGHADAVHALRLAGRN